MDTNAMNALEIARRLAQLDQKEQACKAYALAIQEARGKDPEAELEAAVYILQNGGNYKVAYESFCELYNSGHHREDTLFLLTGAFYEPNVKELRDRYERNCKQLKKYPFLFRKDFLPFEELPIRFYPYDEKHHVPFYIKEERFGAPTDVSYPVVSRNFFRDLEKPILASDVFSQYEIEYLTDNVRPSEWVGRENHVYLHYTDWAVFCAYLQVLDLRQPLKSKKLVFLIGEELEQYPIDFKARFDLDYSQYPLKPVGVQEIQRLIWHTQLSYHNGGDFFNEIFDAHPNLYTLDSFMMDVLMEGLDDLNKALKDNAKLDLAKYRQEMPEDELPVLELLIMLQKLPHRTEKDVFVALFTSMCDQSFMDPASRIAPAIFFQPHFSLFHVQANVTGSRIVQESREHLYMRKLPALREFRYVKTFVPLRRPTTSVAAAGRFAYHYEGETKTDGRTIYFFPDLFAERLYYCGYLVEREDWLFQDSILVRFEDGKLNPKATFTALAAFLDLPYTKSMTYCSMQGKIGVDAEGRDVGFRTSSIYNTYDEYLSFNERYLLEYFLREGYQKYGYDFHYYDGAPVDEARVRELTEDPTGMTDLIRKTDRIAIRQHYEYRAEDGETFDRPIDEMTDEVLDASMGKVKEDRIAFASFLLQGMRYVDQDGRMLRRLPMLKLDPALLEQPLYR